MQRENKTENTEKCKRDKWNMMKNSSVCVTVVLRRGEKKIKKRQ